MLDTELKRLHRSSEFFISQHFWMKTNCIIIVELFESNQFHISTVAWSLPIRSHHCSLVEIPNEALLYTGAGEITDVDAIVLAAGEQGFYLQPRSKWLCSYSCMQNYMLVLRIWPMLASIFTVGVWMCYIHKMKPNTLLSGQGVTNHWEAARNGFLNHLSHFQCCVNTAHLLHPKEKSYGSV